ncbi:MAG: SIS domain-containing protein [Alphaproteobacteria bacterium]
MELENDKYLNTAKQVLAIEIEGLKSLESILDNNFFKLIDLIYKLKGRVIVSGMGKSGHVARKIAATLASTGTAAYFVHPAEASHGDLGMITSNDMVILLSNSGETAELKDLIYYCKRFSITLVAIVRNAKSALVEAANIALILPEIQEASSLRAPTTSTTMMMALGDVISTVVQEKRGFSKEDYHILHPGGKLGAAFIKVENIMHKGDELPLVYPNDIMSDVLLIMTAKKFGCALVVDQNHKLLGSITDGDLRRHMSSDLIIMKAKDVMTLNPITVDPSCFAIEALDIMNRAGKTNLFVVDKEKDIVGIIHIHDCLRAGIK